MEDGGLVSCQGVGIPTIPALSVGGARVPSMEPIYGHRGDVVAWLEDDEVIRNLRGAVIGWLYETAVHGRRGQHAGYFDDGLFRDNHGAVVAWVDGATGGPTKPVKRVRPVQPVREVRPVRSVRQVRQVRAVRSRSWSRLSITDWLPVS